MSVVGNTGCLEELPQTVKRLRPIFERLQQIGLTAAAFEKCRWRSPLHAENIGCPASRSGATLPAE
jgi:hypothetical protein